MKHQNGFTLVELAVALMIIGLLIGGILKGKELILNSEVTATGAQMKNFQMAVESFKNTYRAFPGDMLSPGTRLPNCTSSPCNIPGNNNRMVGLDMGLTTENTNFFVHLKAVDLIPDTKLSSSGWPMIPLGGQAMLIYLSPNWGAGITQQKSAHYLHTTGTERLPCERIPPYDKKYDDGKPNTGDIVLHPSSARAGDGVSYDPNLSGSCTMVDRVKF
jgi:prepilin-type N-terminal cleavage/methylation domain-containing protein